MGTKTTSETKLPEFQQKFLEETVLPYAQDIAGREFTPYEGERVAGMTPLQQQAMTGYGALSMGGPQFQQASETYGQLAGFGMTPMQAATAGPAERAAAAQLGGAATMEGVGAVEAAQAPDQIAVDTLAATDIGQYMSPYTQNVIESSLRTLGGAQDIALDKLAAQAQAARAFGGSRQGVAEAETRKAYGQQASDLVTQQMEKAFRQAQGAAQYDIGQTQAARTLASQQQMQASTLGQQAREAAAAREQAARAGNMQAANQFAMQQAQFEQQAAMANQQAANAMAQYNAGLEQQARQSTFGGQFQAADVMGRGAAGLGATAGQQLQAEMAGLGAQMGAGEAARGLDQAGLDIAYGEFGREQDFPLTGLNALLGAASGIPTGLGTVTQRAGGLGPTLGAIGSAGQGLGAMGVSLPFSDITLKKNIKKVGRINDLNLYRWDWNEKAKFIGADHYPSTGVIAQEVERKYPEHVIIDETGYRRVNYTGLYSDLGTV